MHPNLVDLAVLVLCVAAVVDGSRRGFGPYASELFAVGLPLAGGLAAYAPVANFLHTTIRAPVGLAAFGTFLAILVVGHGVVLHLIHRWIERPVRAAFRWTSPQTRRSAGAVPALAAALGVATVALNASLVLPSPSALQSLVRSSTVGGSMTRSVAFVQPSIRGLLSPYGLNGRPPAANRCDLSSGENSFCSLPFPTNLDIQLDSNAEQRMLTLVNDERASAGLGPLVSDPQLQELAREHSADMYRRKYFSHKTPDGLNYSDRLAAAGINVAAGENIAYASNVDEAERFLVESPEHLGNITNEDFRKVGIGVYEAKGYAEMFTQEFTT